MGREQRAPDSLRPVRITRGYTKYAEGSVLIGMGDTQVVCTASVEERVPPFLRGTGRGWVTAEYGMLPRSTAQRTPRDGARGGPSGRSQEIQRLVGRALRSVIDLDALDERTIVVDCDVIQADGGTRTAAITGGFVALVDCLAVMFPAEETRDGVPLRPLPVRDFVAAVSVGRLDGQALLDLDYEEDVRADVDMNVVGTGSGQLVEVQGTAEGRVFSRRELDELLDLAQVGIAALVKEQWAALGDDIVARFAGWRT